MSIEKTSSAVEAATEESRAEESSLDPNLEALADPTAESAAESAAESTAESTAPALQGQAAAPNDTESPDADADPDPTGIIPEGSVHDTLSGVEQDFREVKSLVEAVVYITDEPLSAQQISAAMERPLELVQKVLDQLVEEYAQSDRGLTVRELAGGYKMGTKPEHHEALKAFVKGLKPSLKLSLAALETLAVIAYKQPITGPEIMEIRGVQGAGVMKTLLDRKLIANAGRKSVVGKPMLYKTTREFLLQFGLNNLNELPTLKEFEELRRLALNDEDVLGGTPEPATAEENEAAAAEALAATKDVVPEDAVPREEPGTSAQGAVEIDAGTESTQEEPVSENG